MGLSFEMKSFRSLGSPKLKAKDTDTGDCVFVYFTAEALRSNGLDKVKHLAIHKYEIGLMNRSGHITVSSADFL